MVQQPPGPPPGGMQPPPMGPPQAPMRPRPQVDMSALPIADIIVAVSSLVFVILAGMGWYNFAGFTEARAKGAMGILGLIVGILVLVFAIVVIANHYLNFIEMPVPVALVYLGAAALLLVFLLLGLLLKPSIGGALYGGVSFKYGVGWVMWILSVVFALGIGAGGLLKMSRSK